MAALQSYADHAHRPRLAVAAGVLAGVALGLVVVDLFERGGRLAVALLCLAMAVLLLVAISRIYVVRLQDRIILLEMRVRLARLGHEAAYSRLTKRQLIALRFASDAELPALIERAVTEHLSSPQIKQAVRDWQADYYRT